MDDFYAPSLYDDSYDWDPQRLNAEWLTINALREMLGIALKGSSTPTYQQALSFGKVLAPQLFDSENTLIGKSKESLLVQEYKQKAEALSQIEKRKVEPLEIVGTDITQLNQLLETSGQRELLKRRLAILQNVRHSLLPQSRTETQLILRDVFKAERNIPTLYEDSDTFREYKISNDRVLRIRVLHPDPPEHSIGADLIYEHYWDKKRLVRLAVVQYKLWEGRVLYLSQAKNLEAQMGRLKTIFCDLDLCKPFEESARKNAYRLPFCTAFLRPTDKLQKPDSRLVSSGLHVPICVALSLDFAP